MGKLPEATATAALCSSPPLRKVRILLRDIGAPRGGHALFGVSDSPDEFTGKNMEQWG